jgi:hypothetical protein
VCRAWFSRRVWLPGLPAFAGSGQPRPGCALLHKDHPKRRKRLRLLFAFLRKALSWTMSTPLSWSPRCSTTYSLKSSRTSSASHLAEFSQSLHACGSLSPMALADGSRRWPRRSASRSRVRSSRADRGGICGRAPLPPSGRSDGLLADAVLQTPSRPFTEGRRAEEPVLREHDAPLYSL